MVGVAHSLVHRRIEFLGKVAQDIAPLVLLAGLHQRALASTIADRLAQCLAAIDDEQIRPVRVDPTPDKAVQELATPERSFHSPESQPKWVFLPGFVYAKRHERQLRRVAARSNGRGVRRHPEHRLLERARIQRVFVRELGPRGQRHPSLLWQRDRSPTPYSNGELEEAADPDEVGVNARHLVSACASTASFS